LSDGIRLGAESSVQSLGRQFCSHAPTVGAPPVAAMPSRGLPTPAVD